MHLHQPSGCHPCLPMPSEHSPARGPWSSAQHRCPLLQYSGWLVKQTPVQQAAGSRQQAEQTISQQLATQADLDLPAAPGQRRRTDSMACSMASLWPQYIASFEIRGTSETLAPSENLWSAHHRSQASQSAAGGPAAVQTTTSSPWPIGLTTDDKPCQLHDASPLDSNGVQAVTSLSPGHYQGRSHV